jgi:hypothetical protein
MLEQVYAAGEWRKLGNIATPLRFTWREFGSVPKETLIPRSEWKGLVDQIGKDSECGQLPPVTDQQDVGQCNANATISAMEYSRKIQGLPYVQLSPADLYHQINGGRDQGSLLEDGIKAAMEVGVGTVADCGSAVWKRGYKPATQEQRAKYRVLEAVLCPTFDHCASAVLHGFGLISGIMWYSNYEPGQDGWLPPGRGGSGGHAIFGYKLTYRNGGREWGIWHQNSWGERWGQKGRFVIPESAYSGPVGGWWAVRQMVTEEGDTPSPREE